MRHISLVHPGSYLSMDNCSPATSIQKRPSLMHQVKSGRGTPNQWACLSLKWQWWFPEQPQTMNLLIQRNCKPRQRSLSRVAHPPSPHLDSFSIHWSTSHPFLAPGTHIGPSLPPPIPLEPKYAHLDNEEHVSICFLARVKCSTFFTFNFLVFYEFGFCK